jgi:hypothetical protein
VPELLINNQPLKAAIQPLAGFGAGAFLCEGAKVGSHAGDVLAARALPRLRWTAAAGAVGASLGGYQPTSRIQFEHTMTLIDPVAPGGVGPHPVREPVPV